MCIKGEKHQITNDDDDISFTIQDLIDWLNQFDTEKQLRVLTDYGCFAYVLSIYNSDAKDEKDIVFMDVGDE